MIKMLKENGNYYTATAKGFVNEQAFKFNQLRMTRRNALVALANLSDAFNRMLSEPKRHQKGIENIHRFVVLNHTLSSHIATLSYYLQTMENVYRSAAFEPVINDTVQYFTNSIALLEDRKIDTLTTTQKQSLRALNEQTEILMGKRRQELQLGFLETVTKKLLIQTKSVTDQFNYIYSIATDINKLSGEIEIE
jgi:uncharacterized membrane protein YccC